MAKSVTRRVQEEVAMQFDSSYVLFLVENVERAEEIWMGFLGFGLEVLCPQAGKVQGYLFEMFVLME